MAGVSSTYSLTWFQEHKIKNVNQVIAEGREKWALTGYSLKHLGTNCKMLYVTVINICVWTENIVTLCMPRSQRPAFKHSVLSHSQYRKRVLRTEVPQELFHIFSRILLKLISWGKYYRFHQLRCYPSMRFSVAFDDTLNNKHVELKKGPSPFFVFINGFWKLK